MATGDRERWDARWAAAPAADPAQFLIELADLLPTAGAALDVAGGAGRNAVWLARRGLAVTLVDVSPVALAQARAAAARAGVPLALVERDLETAPLPPGPFGLVVCLDFLQRALFPALAAALAPGGLLVFAAATRRNLERHPHPSARFLLDDGEAPRLVRGLEILRAAEGWFGDRHEARLAARRPAAPGTPGR
jgi:SAM-dependent methyltransferase